MENYIFLERGKPHLSRNVFYVYYEGIHIALVMISHFSQYISTLFVNIEQYMDGSSTVSKQSGSWTVLRKLHVPLINPHEKLRGEENIARCPMAPRVEYTTFI